MLSVTENEIFIRNRRFTDSEMEKISDSFMVVLQPKKASQLPIVDMR